MSKNINTEMAKKNITATIETIVLKKKNKILDTNIKPIPAYRKFIF
jgi:hypothetical protein